MINSILHAAWRYEKLEKHWFQNEFVYISNSVIMLIDKRPKNRLLLISIVHRKHLES